MTDFMPASEYPMPDTSYTRAVSVSYVDFKRYAIDYEEAPHTDVASGITVSNSEDIP